jgi:tetratricopeptide (TPR) repeat protein
MKRKYRFIFIVLLTCSINNLQSQRDKCGLTSTNSSQLQSLYFSVKGTEFVKLCLERLQFVNHKINVYTISGLNNCFATTIGNQPSIVIDQIWLESCRQQDDWFYVYVLGHEIGHILLNHIYYSNSDNQWTKELSADLVGGILLRKFNYPIDDVGRIIPNNFSLRASKTHPPRDLRIKIINEYLRTNDEKKLISAIGWYGVNKDLLTLSDQQKIETLNIALFNFNKFETRVFFEDIYVKLNSLDNKQYNNIPKHEVIGFLHSAIRLGYISVENFAEQLIKLQFAEESRGNYILEIAPYFQELSLSNQQKIANYIKIENIVNQDLGHNDLFNLARLCIPLAQSEYINMKTLNFVLEDYLPSKLKGDTNNVEYLSILVVYSNYIKDYERAQKYNVQEINLITRLYRQNNDPYYSYQLAKAYYNQGLIRFRTQNYNLALESISRSEVYIPNEYRKLIKNELLYLKARIYLEQDMVKESFSAIQEFIPSNDAFELYIVGLVYLKNNKSENAKFYFEKSCKKKYYKSCEILKLL